MPIKELTDNTKPVPFVYNGELPKNLKHFHYSMKDFNAQQAKQIVDSLYTDELHNILVDIKAKAEQGETVLHIYKPINGKTVDALRDKGFEVTNQPSISIQKDGLYYSIYWA